MDWIVIGTIVIAGWAMLSVLAGQRLSQAQRVAVTMAVTAAEQARIKDSEIPIAALNEAALIGSPAAFNRKR